MDTNHAARSFLNTSTGRSSNIKVSNSDSRELPSAFTSDGFGFVLLRAGQKHPPIERDWQNKPHGLNKAKRWINQGNNLGILVKYPYAVLDLDDPDAVSGLPLPRTTTWETRPGRLAYLIRLSERESEVSKILQGLGKDPRTAQLTLFKYGEHVGELKLQRTYQVVPPSWKEIDGKRVEYRMIQDIPPTTVSLEWLVNELRHRDISFTKSQSAKQRPPEKIIMGSAEQIAATAESCLQNALELSVPGERNNVGFWLARSLRDLGLDPGIASEYMIRYQQAVQDKGDHQYTRDEALKSLESAYNEPPKEKNRKRAMKDDLLEKVLKIVELWHDGAGTGYISIPLNNTKANYPIKSPSVRQWLSQLFFEEYNKTPRKEDISSIVDLMEALAASREVHHPYLRIAEHDNKIYIDLGRADWKLLEIDGAGWRLVDSAPVRFIRHDRMKEIPEPRRGGSWQNVIELLRLPDRESSTLILGWMLQAVWPHGPYVHLVLDGEQGSGKSTLATLLKLITDPSDHLLRRPPRDEEDLFVAAVRERILSFDNLSGIHDWLSDALCCFSTGAAYSKRKKYTDWEEAAISVRRPCILNGIEALPARPDLLDRTIIISLRPLAAEHRMTEDLLIASVEGCLPEIWGLLADAASAGLRNRDRAREELAGKLPRMADFAVWVTSCEEVMPWARGEFLRLYNENKRAGSDTLLEGDILAMSVIELARQEALNNRCFEGTPTSLFNELMVVAKINPSYPPRTWPANASWMMRRLKRLAPALRNHGVEIDLDYRTQNTRSVRICLKPVEEVGKLNDSGRHHDTNDGNTKMPSCANRYAATSNDTMTPMTAFYPESPSKEKEHQQEGSAKSGEMEKSGENAVIGVMPSCDGDAYRKSNDGKIRHDVIDEKCRHCVDELREKILTDLSKGSRQKSTFDLSTNIGARPYDVAQCLEALEREGLVESVPDAFGNARWRLKG